MKEIQSRIKGNRIRYKYDSLKFTLSKHSYIVEELQAFCRSKLLKTKVKKELSDIETSHPPLIKLQSCIRAFQVRRKLMVLNSELNGAKKSIMSLLAIIRGGAARNSGNAVLFAIDDKHKEKITSLQSLIRGTRTRSCLTSSIHSLEEENSNIIQLSACLQGKFVRNEINSLFAPVNHLSETVHDLQASFSPRYFSALYIRFSG